MARVIKKEGAGVALRFHGLRQFKKDFSYQLEENDNYFIYESLRLYKMGMFNKRYTVINGDLKKTGDIWHRLV